MARLTLVGRAKIMTASRFMGQVISDSGDSINFIDRIRQGSYFFKVIYSHLF